jgi:hypothetical protein
MKTLNSLPPPEADTFSMRTVNTWSAAWADTPPMASSSVASTDILFHMVGPLSLKVEH